MASWINTATFSTINVGLPDIAESFPGHSLSAIGWVITSYAIVFGAFLLPAGRIADRFGRLPIYNLGLALFAFGGIVAATSPTFALLIVGRVVQGAGAAINAPASIGLLLEVTPPNERVRAITLWSACTTIGGASGPTLGALIIETAGWRWAIAAPAVLTVVVWWVGRRHLPASAPTKSTAKLDVIGTVLATAAMALLVLAISEGNNWGWGSPATVSCVRWSRARDGTAHRALAPPPRTGSADQVVPLSFVLGRDRDVGLARSDGRVDPVDPSAVPAPGVGTTRY